MLNNHSGTAISPTLIGSLVVMGGTWFILPGAIAVGLIIKWFDWLYTLGNEETNRYKAAVLHSFCFGAIFNMIVLAREGLDSFVSRVVFLWSFSVSVCCWQNCCTGCLTVQGLCTDVSHRAAQRCRKSE